MDHVLRYHDNPEVKMVVVLGEVRIFYMYYRAQLSFSLFIGTCLSTTTYMYIYMYAVDVVNLPFSYVHVHVF